MTITQYSRIQHRRGLLADLPSVLNTSELGHVLDQQRLFIGNGQLADGAPIVGNTEIITDFTLLGQPKALQWIYRSNTPVIAQTGPNPQTPVVRSVGQKLDDYVNVRDFGAVGNGIADDTAAINRALQQLYTVAVPGPYALEAGYRALYFPAGVYNLSDYIYIPPHATLIGDGLTKTVIKQANASKSYVTRTADSLFQNYSNGIGTNSATLPTNIYIEGITFQHIADQSVINLELSTNVYFNNCGMIGAWTGPSDTNSYAVFLDNLTYPNSGAGSYTPMNIKFDHCQFMFVSDVLYFDINHGRFAKEVYFDNCDIAMCYRGIYANTDFQDIKVTNSYFLDVTNSSIYAAIITQPTLVQGGFLSNNNTFERCGSVGVPVINYIAGALRCRSLADAFINSNGPNISDIGLSSFEISTLNSININNTNYSAKQGPITLAGSATNQPTGVTIDLTKQDTVYIDYTIVIGSIVRTGRLSIFSNAGNSVIKDDFSETSSSGLSFSLGTISGNILPINYSSTSGTSASWILQVKSWLS